MLPADKSSHFSIIPEQRLGKHVPGALKYPVVLYSQARSRAWRPRVHGIICFVDESETVLPLPRRRTSPN